MKNRKKIGVPGRPPSNNNALVFMLIAIISKDIYDKKFTNKKHLNPLVPCLDYPTIKTTYILSILNRIMGKGQKIITMSELSDNIKSSGLAYLTFQGNKRGIITGVAMPESLMAYSS